MKNIETNTWHINNNITLYKEYRNSVFDLLCEIDPWKWRLSQEFWVIMPANVCKKAITTANKFLPICNYSPELNPAADGSIDVVFRVPTKDISFLLINVSLNKNNHKKTVVWFYCEYPDNTKQQLQYDYSKKQYKRWVEIQENEYHVDRLWDISLDDICNLVSRQL